VHGLTTAASLWITSAIGTLFGVGLYELAVGGAVLSWLVLSAARWLDKHMPQKNFAEIAVRSRRETLVARASSRHPGPVRPDGRAAEPTAGRRRRGVRVGRTVLRQGLAAPDGTGRGRCAAIPGCWSSTSFRSRIERAVFSPSRPFRYTPPMTFRVHIDTDCGVDDALALAMLARARDILEVGSVSAVFGNTYVDQAAANARGVLRLAGCGAEVYIGAGSGVAKRRVERMRPAHGVDGLNGAGFSQRWKLPELDRGHGTSLLAFVARRQITGLFLGPLTNLAQGLLEDPAAFRDWKPTIMAGAFAVEGKAAGGADFNSWSDPEACSGCWSPA
jgi:hypothetical protein